ncbi:MAG: cupin domain-containing protein [Pseudomonadota bacterium]
MEDLHANLLERVVLDTHALPWEPSPSPGVQRRRLDRLGGESGRATSIVRYDAGAAFPAHAHPAGEEILVLDGVFSDEHGDYPAGTYLLNPPGTRHAPFTRDGCTLFVKLRQHDGPERQQVCLDTQALDWLPGVAPGLSVKPLYSQAGFPENVALVRWEPGTEFHRHVHPGGEEILVLEGVFEDELGSYPAGTWLRNPHMSVHTPFSREGCIIHVKVGGL